MIYVPEELLFVHIPRTGGSSIHSAILPTLARGESVYVTAGLGHFRKHIRACELLTQISEDEWKSLFKFAVIRNPFDLAESLYSLFRREIPCDHPGKSLTCQYRRSFKEYAEKVRQMTFSEWLREHLTPIAESGGWWSHFCERDGVSLGFEAIHYEFLGLEWEVFRRRFGFSELPRENAAPRVDAIQWQKADREFISEGFRRDFERFGYSYDHP